MAVIWINESSNSAYSLTLQHHTKMNQVAAAIEIGTLQCSFTMNMEAFTVSIFISKTYIVISIFVFGSGENL